MDCVFKSLHKISSRLLNQHQATPIESIYIEKKIYSVLNTFFTNANILH